MYSHVFNGATESVRDRAVVNGFFTQPEVCQLYVTFEENGTNISLTLTYILKKSCHYKS